MKKKNKEPSISEKLLCMTEKEYNTWFAQRHEELAQSHLETAKIYRAKVAEMEKKK